MPGLVEPLSDERRKRIIHEKSHIASSGAEKRQLALAHRFGCVMKRLECVVALQIRIGGEDFVFRHTIRNHRHNGGNRNTQSTNAGNTPHLFQTNGDPGEPHRFLLLAVTHRAYRVFGPS
jgi:hypothetical protein